MQLINVLEGGSLYQEIPRRTHAPRVDHHGRRRRAHRVRFVQDTRLAAVTESRWALVATEHHQAIRDLAPGFIPSAVADDGMIEAIENPELPQILAVQWHPERRRHSAVTRRLFGEFVDLAREYRAQK
jgi:putative glutamine amidotransferase